MTKRQKLLFAALVIFTAVNTVLFFMAADDTNRSSAPLNRYISGTNIKSLR